jgi:uncharacterized protein YndB with AHSA1/START domain
MQPDTQGEELVSTRYVTHDTMVIERHYAASVSRVFSAWADPKAKAQWMLGTEDDFDPQVYDLDFRIGGHERITGLGQGDVYTYEARYDDIVENQRIVYSYFMLRNEVKMSVSVTAVEFRPEPEGTHLVITEHGVYLDGEDKPEFRLEGISAQMDALTGWLDEHGD